MSRELSPVQWLRVVTAKAVTKYFSKNPKHEILPPIGGRVDPGQAQADVVIIQAVVAAMNGTAPVDPEVLDQLDALFAQHQLRLYHLCHRMVGDAERAEELAQDAMLTAYRKLPEFRGDSRFGTWIYSIAKHLCLNAIRRRTEVLSEDGVIEVGDSAFGALYQLRQQEREALVTEAASAVLDPLEQEAVYLRYVEGLPRIASPRSWACRTRVALAVCYSDVDGSCNGS
jgi:RNA polymerase sigma-70 factor (ECF subfamily)